MRASPLLILVTMSAIWGLTWIAIKTGIGAVPPIFLAATRFVAAGIILLFIFRREIDLAAWRGRWLKLTIVASLIGTFCYAGIFWGMQYTPSGIAAIINLSLIPVGLLLFGALLRAETIGITKSLGVITGVAGLILMFAPELQSGETASAAGVAAITLGTVTTCLGSVLSRRWLSDLPTGAVSGVLILISGAGLALFSALLEPVTLQTWAALLRPQIFLSWLFLVVFGSLIAFTLYLHLIKIWGPLRAGLYAFISPIVALIAGYFVFGETLAPIQAAASVLLILAAAIVMAPESFFQRFSQPKRVACADETARP